MTETTREFTCANCKRSNRDTDDEFGEWDCGLCFDCYQNYTEPAADVSATERCTVCEFEGEPQVDIYGRNVCEECGVPLDETERRDFIEGCQAIARSLGIDWA